MSENPVAPENAVVPESPAASDSKGKREGKENGKFPRGIWVRLFAYLIAGHVFAGFLYLLFEMGAK
ncbi:DUF6126 family protein [Streptomyces albipurpureus]|uniref:DUF6126 family protein n=1 Tax=Streptomyces albipurpureus TaxID=2897419 RepID=A0ABT0UF83_9ACTN|nr:DUF6126 family protein [Streptomyces sp. CWNU-1]MCM2386766.1 DUF6126 family protein [Streptomyces sp. CWNU-1]